MASSDCRNVFQTFYEGSQEPQIPKFTELQTVADVYQGHGPSLELNGEPDQNDSFDDTETQPSQSTSTNMDRSLVCDTIADEKHLVDEDD